MLGTLTYNTILALTRERLKAIDAMLLTKIRSQQNVGALERQVRVLARNAHQWMSLAPHLPNDSALPPFARKLSQQAVTGSAFATMPKYAAPNASSHEWLYTTIHAGNPDPDRQMIFARSTDLMIRFWEQSQKLINGSNKNAELDKVRAFLLGYACHIAADVLSPPFINSLSWQLGDGQHAQLTQQQVADGIENSLARVYRPATSTTGGDVYKDWWVKKADLPAKLFDAYTAALEETYGTGARPGLPGAVPSDTVPAPPQVSHSFWKTFSKDAPPELTAKLLEDGYASFSSSLQEDYVWTWSDWLAATAWIFFPPIATYPLIVAMPHTRALFKDGATVDGQPVDKERGWFGLVMAPLVASSPAPLILSIWIAARSSFGVGPETIFGWAAGGVNVLTSIIFLATLSSGKHPALRWSFLFAVPFIGLLIHAVFVLTRGTSSPRRTQLALASLLPCCITVLYVLFHLAWHQSQDLGMNGWLKKDGGDWGNAGFLGGWILWTGLMVGAWMLISRLLMSRPPEAVAAATKVIDSNGHYLRMFEHSSLVFDPDLSLNPTEEARNPTLASHMFPAGRIPLLKIWWEGTGELWMRCDRNVLRFSTTGDGTGNPQSVLAPAAPMTASEFATFLTETVKDGADFHQSLKATLFDPSDPDFILPPGEVFADGGDEKTTIADHDTEAAKFVKLSATEPCSATLFHAPQSHLAAFYGQRGPLFVDAARRAEAAGAGNATFAGTAVTGDATTRFATFFRPGDAIVSTTASESRIVLSIQDDTHLTVNLPFSAAVGGAAQAYKRAADTRDIDTPAGTLQSTAVFGVYQGTGLDALFLPGDVVRAVPAGGVPEERIITEVVSGTELRVQMPFGSALMPFGSAALTPTPCVRVGRSSLEGFRYMPPSPSGSPQRDSLLERAVDLAAILSMGAASHLMTDTARGAVTTGPDEDQHGSINKVHQVFRNWNLSRRRINEWQMLVTGRALSEKHETPPGPDPLQPLAPTPVTPSGESIANQLGWIPLMDKWLDVAKRPGISTMAEEALQDGDPTNKALSQGVAFLLDLPLTV